MYGLDSNSTIDGRRPIPFFIMERIMEYKGIELKEITKQQIFDQPKELLVWNDTFLTEPKKVPVCAIIKLENYYVAIEKGKVPSYQWQHCAEIPKELKPRQATNKELAKWVSEGKGQVLGTKISTTYDYSGCTDDSDVESFFKVRKWEDSAWHDATVDYMGIE